MSALVDRVSSVLAWLLVAPVFALARLCERDVTWFANVTDER